MEQNQKQKITPFLWFDNNAEEAVTFYITVFKNSRIISISRYGEGSMGPAGSVMTVTFEIEGQEFIALNGGPIFKFTEAISFYVKSETQPEIDALWEKLAEGGEIQPCGWLKDKFGVSWQIVPPVLGEMLQDKDPARANRVLQAMMKMKKIDIGLLKAAYHQSPESKNLSPV